MTILIDNGHGSDTPGKRSPDGLFREYSYTREIARRVVSELSDCGYDARLLVPETEDIPLMERYRRVNAICDEVGTVNVILYAQAGMPEHKFKFASGANLQGRRKFLKFSPLSYSYLRGYARPVADVNTSSRRRLQFKSMIE